MCTCRDTIDLCLVHLVIKMTLNIQIAVDCFFITSDRDYHIFVICAYRVYSGFVPCAFRDYNISVLCAYRDYNGFVPCAYRD